MRIFTADSSQFSPEPDYNTTAKRFFPWDGFEATPWGGAWVAVLPGETSTPHAHEEHEAFFVVRGEGTLSHGDERHPIGFGSSAKIEPGTAHSITNTGSEDLVFISVWWDELPPAASPVS